TRTITEMGMPQAFSALHRDSVVDLPRRVYKSPPIEEASVECRFSGPAEWDTTLPGQLQQHPSSAAGDTGRARQHSLMQAAVRRGEGVPTVAVQEGPWRVQLPNAESTRLLTVAPGLLGVNVLRPYEGWDAFRSRARVALDAYCDLTGVTE